jgi:hypothetical protein
MTTVISGKIQLPPRRADDKRRHIAIATPAYKGEFSTAYVRSLFMLLTAAPAMSLRFSFKVFDYADIVASRNYLLSYFFYNMTNCSHLLFIDADMGFPSQLIGEMVALQEDVVGVVYPTRSIDLEKLHGLYADSYAKAYAKACSFIGSPKQPHPRNPGFRKVDSCGTGIMLISRECITLMLERCPSILDTRRFKRMPWAATFSSFLTPFNKIELEDREFSEDLSFCRRWTEDCSGAIYANITHDIEHVGITTIKTSQANLH